MEREARSKPVPWLALITMYLVTFFDLMELVIVYVCTLYYAGWLRRFTPFKEEAA